MKMHFPRKGTIVKSGPYQVISTGRGFRANWKGTEGNDRMVAQIKGIRHAIYGYDGDDFIVGGNKQNSLFGGNGDDVIKGGDDVDMLFGNQGNDTLDGGKGRNYLWGSEGKDTFVINSEPGSHSEINDFKQGEDKISIKGERGKDWDFGTNGKGEVIIERIDGGSKAQVVATINGVKPDGISDSDILQSGTSEKDIYSSEVDAESAVNTAAVGHHGGPHHVGPDFGQTGESILKESGMDGLRESGMDGLRESGMDGLRESDPQTAAADSLTGEADESTGNFTSTVRRFFSQSDSVTGDAFATADTDGSPSWFHMHHDDGINDGYLDMGTDASGFDSFLLQSGADSLTGEADESTGNFTRIVREIFGRSDSLTGDVLANVLVDGGFPWFQLHHENGIQDGYLDVGADASGFDSFLLQSGSDLIAPIAEPFADAAAITDLVTGKSSPMETATDPLVAAGPLDAVKVDEPRNNDF